MSSSDIDDIDTNQTIQSYTDDIGRSTCPLCNKFVHYLRDHIETVHGEKKFTCSHEGCGLNFAKKFNFNRHVLLHKNENKIFTCPICKKSFRQKNQLELHYTTHLKVERITKHQCHKCDKYLSRAADLKRHKKAVHQPKLYKCNFCPARRFSFKSEVVRHIRSFHYGAKPKKRRPSRRRIPIREIASVCPYVEEDFEVGEEYCGEDEEMFGGGLLPRNDEEFMNDEVVEDISATEENNELEQLNILVDINNIVENIPKNEENIVEQFEILVENLEENADEAKLISQNEIFIELLVEPRVETPLATFNPKWECQRCNFVFESLERLKLHNKRNHNWICSKCPGGKQSVNSFQRKEDFELHWMENHRDDLCPVKLECLICRDLFKDKAALHTHQKNDHGLQPPKRDRRKV